MKTIILVTGVVSALFLAGCSHQKKTSQQVSSVATSQKAQAPSLPEAKIALFYRNGQMMVFQAGQYSPLENDTVLQDGSVVSKSGQVRRKDGMTLQLKEGQSITQDGRIVEPSVYK